MTSKKPLFLDTSIQVARFTHSPRKKEQIADRVRGYEAVTGLVVRQEFKRRVLTEARYILTKLNEYGSYTEVVHHVARLPDNYWRRKRNICLGTLANIFPKGTTEEELTERAKLKMRALLVYGLDEFDATIDRMTHASSCECATEPVVEKVPLKRYELPSDRCSEQTACAVADFLSDQKEWCQKIADYLASLSDGDKTDELRAIESFLRDLLANALKPPASRDPCLTVGDLLIALESAGLADTFYTLNYAESRHLAKCLGQSLVVGRVDPTKPDESYQAGTAWPPKLR